MIKRLVWMFSLFILFFSYNISMAKEQVVVTAPGGGFIDIEKNVMKYRGSDSQLVEVRWDNLILEANYLEYNKGQETLKGKDKVNLLQTAPMRRVLTATEISANLIQKYFTANQEVTLNDEKSLITGNRLEWDQKKDSIKISGQVTVKYKDWILKGDSMEGQLEKGYYTVSGQVEASNKNNLLRGGKLVFNRQVNKVFAQENPVLIRGKNEMSASEIIYNLDSNQIIANGTVKTRIIDEAETQ